jgi:hypothetical protein
MRRTVRWPQRSAAAPSSGPDTAVPTPTSAAVAPASEYEPRSADTAVMTATTDIAKGSFAMTAMGRYPQPSRRMREANT